MKSSAFALSLSLLATTLSAAPLAARQTTPDPEFSIKIELDTSDASTTRQGPLDLLTAINLQATKVSAQRLDIICQAFTDIAGTTPLVRFTSETVVLGDNANKKTIGSVVCATSEAQLDADLLKLGGATNNQAAGGVVEVPFVTIQAVNSGAEAGASASVPANGSKVRIADTGLANLGNPILANELSITDTFGRDGVSCAVFTDAAATINFGGALSKTSPIGGLQERPVDLTNGVIICEV